MFAIVPQPVIFAHRGASAYAPENTLAAFNLAVEQGADGIELDAKLSADGHVVVVHDPTLARTTGAPDQVKDMALDDLHALDAGSFFSKKFKGEKIPTLEEVFETFGKKTLINVELTNYNTRHDHLVETVCMLVKRFGLQDRVLFSSFLGSNLSDVRSFIPNAQTGLLALPGILGAWHRSFGFAFGKYDALHPNIKNTTQEQIYFVHRLKRRVHVWTVNEAHDMRRLFKWGVNAIFTDDPPLAVRVRGEIA
jgi:glycerophosphoryl diester phosphodiesterase